VPGPRKALLVLGLVSAIASGCAGSSPNSDKAGGSGGGTTRLRLAFTPAGVDQLPAVQDFISRVTSLSRGTIRIQLLATWGSFEPDAEAQVVRATASGAVDLGVTRSNVFDTLGVSSFEALSAPMLIDSYPLENAVLRSPIPGRMLAGLKRLGVAGLAVLGDELRVPISVHRPLLAPADWRGLTVGTYRSAVQEQVIRALGATPLVVFGPFRTQALVAGRIQAFEQDVVGAENNSLVGQAPWFAANVALWPEIDVLLVNPGRLASLTGQQREWLAEAASAASTDSATLASDDGAYVRDDCAAGARFVYATSSDLAAIRRSLAGVYQQIKSDPQTNAFIEQIQRLKGSTPHSPVIRVPARCARKR
jgi:TRAP-type C4-dicarboxylate transport system substrate-binding protein